MILSRVRKGLEFRHRHFFCSKEKKGCLSKRSGDSRRFANCQRRTKDQAKATKSQTSKWIFFMIPSNRLVYDYTLRPQIQDREFSRVLSRLKEEGKRVVSQLDDQVEAARAATNHTREAREKMEKAANVLATKLSSLANSLTNNGELGDEVLPAFKEMLRHYSQ